MCKVYDILIIGAGCAGMQLMHSIVNHPIYNNESVLLIDDGNSNSQGKSWCFWHDHGPHKYENLISKSWDSITIGLPDSLTTRTISPYRYSYIDSDHFFEYHHQVIGLSKNVSLVHDYVVHVSRNDGIFCVKTKLAEYKSAQVFSGAFGEAHELNRPPVINLKQHFWGYFIETESPVFSSNAATLMDFGVPQHGGVNFMYVLPFSPNNALVEFTGFSSQIYEADFYEKHLHQYIQDRWKTHYTIKKKERGVIPMTDFAFSRLTPEGAIAIGTAAGMVKSTTGYAFNRILNDSKMLADCALEKKRVLQFEKNRFGFYDGLFLSIIQKNPEKAKHIFEELFGKVPFTEILRFLDEKSTVWNEIPLLLSLPKKIFIQSLFDSWKSKL